MNQAVVDRKVSLYGNHLPIDGEYEYYVAHEQGKTWLVADRYVEREIHPYGNRTRKSTTRREKVAHYIIEELKGWKLHGIGPCTGCSQRYDILHAAELEKLAAS